MSQQNSPKELTNDLCTETLTSIKDEFLNALEDFLTIHDHPSEAILRDISIFVNGAYTPQGILTAIKDKIVNIVDYIKVFSLDVGSFYYSFLATTKVDTVVDNIDRAAGFIQCKAVINEYLQHDLNEGDGDVIDNLNDQNILSGEESILTTAITLDMSEIG